MYVSLNGTLTAGRLGWPEFAELAAKAGFLGVDLNLGKAMEAGLEQTRTLLAKLRLKPAISGLPVEFRKDDTLFQQGMGKLDEAARFTALLGCPRMSTWIMPSSDLPKPEQRKIYLDRFQAVAAVLAKHNVRLGLENVSPVHLRKRSPHEFIWRTDEMLDFAKECGPNVGLLLDSWHWHHAEGKISDIIAAGKARIIHVQAADAPKLAPEDIRDNERLMPGEGIIDFNAFFGALKKIGYIDGVSPEIFGRGLKDMPPEEGAKLGLETTVAAMKKAGVLS
ncbi:MAG TPA: sugar phosphate isomerase/epimerase family protein [Bryobacteraceae bacterium]|nr:sugar phosphate isomerase/epimerase family protein [Bryobacteraceae bacterium]